MLHVRYENHQADVCVIVTYFSFFVRIIRNINYVGGVHYFKFKTKKKCDAYGYHITLK